MFKIVLILAIIALVSAQQFQSIYTYPKTGCSGPSYLAITPVSSGACQSRGCTSQSGVSAKLTCSNSLEVPAGFAGFATYTDSQCANLITLIGIAGLSKNTNCVGYLGNSYSGSCTSTNVTFNTYTGSSTCSGTPASITYSTACTGAGLRGFCNSPASVAIPSLFVLLALIFLLF